LTASAVRRSEGVGVGRAQAVQQSFEAGGADEDDAGRAPDAPVADPDVPVGEEVADEGEQEGAGGHG